MPKNTRVHRCVDKLKKAKEEGAAIAICQASTKQGYVTGKKLNSSRAYKQIGLVLAETITGTARKSKSGDPKQKQNAAGNAEGKQGMLGKGLTTKDGKLDAESVQHNMKANMNSQNAKGSGNKARRRLAALQNSSRAYKQIGLVLAEAMGHKVDEAAPLVALGAAARVGAGVIARSAAAAARLAAQGAKSGAKGLGKGAKKAAISAKDMAVDAGKEKLISVAQEKAADAKTKLVGRVKSKLSKGRGLQAGPEGVAIGDDAAKKKGELKAQSYSDTDLEEGKIMNKYVRTLSEAKKPKEERMPVGKSKYGPVTISTRKTPSGSKGQGNGRTTQDMQLDADPTRPNKNAQAALKQRLKTNQNIRKHSGPHDGTPSEVATGKGNKARKRVLKKVLAMESDVYFRLGHIFLEAFAGPTASKYGDSRSSAGIKDPQVKADAKKAKARMDKKLGVKTNPRAKDVVQAAMNTRRRAARRGETPAGSIDNLKR